MTLPVDFHHPWGGLADVLLLFASVSRALLVQIGQYSRAPAHAIVRDAVDGRPGGEVEDHHLVQGAGSLRSDPVAGVLCREVQAVLAAEIPHTTGSVHQELVDVARTSRVQSVADAVAPGHIALLAKALGPGKEL